MAVAAVALQLAGRGGVCAIKPPPEEPPPGEDSEGADSVDKTVCAPKCKLGYVGDRNCDPECYVEACQFDGGDCDENWEIRRTVVLGPYYREVDYVEYTAVGPDGSSKKVSMQEGRHWEGIDVRTSEERANWRRMLSEQHKDRFEDENFEGRPSWNLNDAGDRVPAFRTDEAGNKISIDRHGNDLLNDAGGTVPWTGQAGGQNAVRGLDYEYDDYYQDE